MPRRILLLILAFYISVNTWKLMAQDSELAYVAIGTISPQLDIANINSKGQVAGVARVGGERVLHIWLPESDYGLEAGLHTYPIPATIDGFDVSTLNYYFIDKLDIADDGSVFIFRPTSILLNAGKPDYEQRDIFNVRFGKVDALSTADRWPGVVFKNGSFRVVKDLDDIDVLIPRTNGYNMSSNGTVYSVPAGVPPGTTGSNSGEWGLEDNSGSRKSYNLPNSGEEPNGPRFLPPDNELNPNYSVWRRQVYVTRGNSSGQRIGGLTSTFTTLESPKRIVEYQVGIWENNAFSPLSIPKHRIVYPNAGSGDGTGIVESEGPILAHDINDHGDIVLTGDDVSTVYYYTSGGGLKSFPSTQEFISGTFGSLYLREQTLKISEDGKIYKTDSKEFYDIKTGRIEVLSELMSSNEEVFAPRIEGINASGWIVAKGAVPDESEPFGFRRVTAVLKPLNSPKLDITVLPDQDNYSIDEALEVQIRVIHSGDGPATYSFTEGLFTQDPEPEDGETPVVAFGEFELPEPFTLSEDDPERTFSIPAVTEKPGVLKLISSVSVQPSEGEPYNLEADAKILVNPLAVTVTITNKEHLINQTPEEKWSDLAQQLNAARREAGQEPYANLIEIKLDIKNAGEDTLENVSVPDALKILSLIKSTDLESLGVPLNPILLVTPAEKDNRIDLTTPDSTVTIPDFTLEEDETKSFTWILEAFDANTAPESDDSADLEFKALILASLQGETIQSLATEEFSVIEKVLLKWGIKPRDGRTNYLSGQSVWLDAYIENVSEESGFPKDLLVMVFQTPEGNVGGGYLVEAGQNLANTQPKDDPDSYQFFVLPSEGETRKDLQGFFRTLETQESSQGHVEYDVRVWTIEEDDSLSNADDQAHLNEDEGWIREYEVTLAPNYLNDRSALIEECLESGEFPWLCGMAEGIYNKLGPGLVDLAGYGIELAKKTGNYSLLMVSETCQSMVDLWKGIQGDEEAMAAFVQDLYDYYAGLVQLGAIPGELGSKAPMALKQFGDMAVESFADFMFKIETGDAEQRQLVIGEFLGANPDLLLEPLIALRGFRNMRLAMHEIADGVSDNYIAAAQKQRVDKNLATTATRVEDAFSAGNDAAKALRAGDELTESMLLKIYGITKKQLQDLQKIAEDFDIVLTFRSRNPLSVEWLEKGLARFKPQALKHKTINDIDVEFLGYDFPTDARATIGIVEPPKKLQGIADDEALREAIDAYVDDLAKVHPKLADDDVLRYEVADRLKTRVEEWDELVPRNPETDEVLETYKISVAFDAQAQNASKAGKTVKVDDVRTVQQKAIESYTDPVTGDIRRRFELKTTGPPGEGEGASIFKAITGDVDFLAILEPNGMMITDLKRRIEIYEALASVIGMQHGESFTFFLQKAREKYIRCCVAGAPDAEAMVAIGPGARQTPRAAYFVDNMSLMRDGPNTRFLGPQKKLRDRYFRVVRKKGEPIKIRREDVNGEFLLLDGYPQSLAVKRNFISYFQPKIYRQLLSEWFKRFVFFSPTYVARVLDADESETQGFPIKQSDTLETRAEGDALYAIDGPILQIDESVDLEALRLWTEDAGWQPIDRATAFALGDPQAADMAPMTALAAYTPSGSREITVLNLADLEASGRFFESGDRVVIAPGHPHEEYAVVAFTEPFTLTGPLVFDHDSGTMIAFLEADKLDSDGDNIPDDEEETLGTLPNLADSDGDGLSDSQELAYGTDPRDSNSRFEFADALLANETGKLRLSWQGVGGVSYTVEGSYDLDSWFVMDTLEVAENGLMEVSIDFATEEGVTRFVRLRPGQ